MKLKYWNKLGFLLLFVLLAAFQSSCGWKTTEFTLTVIVGEGITGVPESGTYLYQEFDEIEYRYEFDDQVSIQPEMFLNKNRNLVLEGILVMYCDTTLTIEQIDIRKDWKMVMSEEDLDDVDWVITFSGADLRSGTFSDDRGYIGTWEVTGSNDLTVSYDDWGDYTFSGTLSSLAGNWQGEGRSGSWYMYLDS
jgi:hypothetical protein